MNRRFTFAIAIIGAALSAGAQAPDRIATTTDALIANPVFFNGRRIVVRHALKETGELTELDATAKPIYVYWRERPAGSEGEIRGEFWDLGRMLEGDTRFSAYNFSPLIAAVNNGRWPAREQIFVVLAATLIPGPPSSGQSLRAITLAPEQFDGRTVTLAGRFRGRNLYGDLPESVAKSKWDFVLQSADAALWVTGLRPKGRDFDLDPAARVDTGKWLEVTGTVHRDAAAVWLAAESMRVAATPTEAPVEVAAPTVPQEAAPRVIFSAPLANDTDVAVTGRVRIQFSRDMNGGSFRDHVHVRYAAPAAATADPPVFTATYNDGNRSLEIRFTNPLEPFKPVTIQLDEGITAIDGQPLAPWSLTFTTGGA